MQRKKLSQTQNGKAHRGGLAPDKYLSDTQRKRLMQHVRQTAERAALLGHHRPIIDELIIKLLDGTGIRANELCCLTIADLPCSHGKDAVYIRNGKGSVSRVVDISEKTAEYLSRFVKIHRKNATPADPLIINERGNRFSYRSLYSKISSIGQKCGINLYPHMLRHTYATRLYGVERDLFLVQNQLGHANVQTTQVYAKTSPESARRQINSLDL
jgi:site-specific recombinase XerD